MELNKTNGCWEEYGTTELDDVAYHLYCNFVREFIFSSNETRAKIANQFYVMDQKDNEKNIYKKYYVQAEAILRNKKINKLKNGI